MEFLVI